MPVIPLLHLPLILILQDWINLNRIKKIVFGLILILALYFQLINSLYPYWRQLEFLRPYNLDSLPTIRYNPQLSHLALHNTFFLSFVRQKLTGNAGNFHYREKSWMRTGTLPISADVTLARIDVDLGQFNRPDIFMLEKNFPLGTRKAFAATDVLMVILFGAGIVYVLKYQYD